MKKVLIPMPCIGVDPSESAIPWKLMQEASIEVVFATPNGHMANTDQRMLDGKGLGIWKKLLMARADAVMAYKEMDGCPAFKNPIKYVDIQSSDYDGILLPGGHDKPVKEYLESTVLQDKIIDFFKDEKQIAAICHGVVLLARSKDKSSGLSVLHEYKTTALLKSQEMTAYNLTRTFLGDYYLTYPGLTVEDEVKSVLSNPNNFIKGPFPIMRDSKQNMQRGFFVKDRNYISARWPGDLYNFTHVFIDMVLQS